MHGALRDRPHLSKLISASCTPIPFNEVRYCKLSSFPVPSSEDEISLKSAQIIVVLFVYHGGRVAFAPFMGGPNRENQTIPIFHGTTISGWAVLRNGGAWKEYVGGR